VTSDEFGKKALELACYYQNRCIEQEEIIEMFCRDAAAASAVIAPAQDNEIITPVMDDYRLTCCDCGLVHEMDFRALEVTEKFADDTWTYEALDPAKYRLMFRARRLDSKDTALR
jgi:hypothetical protein